MQTCELYQRFALEEARNASPILEQLANLVAQNDRLLGFLESLPPHKRQPNLFFGVVRLLSGELLEGDSFAAFVDQHQAQIFTTMLDKRTQTNEPARAATLLPILAQIEGPIALMEVGAAAGLCLLPDYYSYQYNQKEHRLTPSHIHPSPLFQCRANPNTPLPNRIPDVIWRRGLDVNPLDVTSTNDMNWLRALIWPEQSTRLAHFNLAVDIACHVKPVIDPGDLLEQLLGSIQSVPSDATLVIFHSAVLAYTPIEVREKFRLMVGEIDCHWISNEHPRLFPDIADKTQTTLSNEHFLLAVNGQPIAETGPHGQSIDWLPDAQLPSMN